MRLSLGQVTPDLGGSASHAPRSSRRLPRAGRGATVGLATLLLWLAAPSVVRAQDFRDSVPAEPGGTLEVRLDHGSVEVETHSDERVRVEAEASGMKFDLSSDGTDTRLVGKRSGWFSGFSIGGVRVRVKVPERYAVDVRTLGGSIELYDIGGWVRARTSGGSIEVDGARGDVDLYTSGGRVYAEDVQGDVIAKTSGGAIRVEEIDGAVEARTSGGSIRLHEVTGPVTARTSGGPVSVRFAGEPEGEVRTSGGGIEAEFSEDAALDLDARTSGGRVRIEDDIEFRGSVESSRVKGAIRGGGAPLRLETSGGSIRVRIK